MTGLNRNLEAKIDALLHHFPAVLIVGARQSGKTTLARKCRPDWRCYDLEKGSDPDFVSRDFDFFFRSFPSRVIVDEAQELPQLFKELRGVIDGDRGQNNRFLLTSSSSPALLAEAADSLAGRIAIVEVGTLKMNERYGTALPDFYRIFDHGLDAAALADLLALVPAPVDPLVSLLQGGYPEPVLADDDTFFRHWMENYFQTYINRDVRKLFPRLDGSAAMCH